MTGVVRANQREGRNEVGNDGVNEVGNVGNDVGNEARMRPKRLLIGLTARLDICRVGGGCGLGADLGLDAR